MSGAKKARLPAALAARAARLKKAKEARLRREGRDLLALIRLKKKVVSDAFYEMGTALARLRAKEMLKALGFGTFEALCAGPLRMSVEFATGLADVASRVPRRLAIDLGQSKAVALVDLAKATPRLDDPERLYRDGVKLPDGRHFDVRSANPHQIELAAKQVRHARAAGKPRRGLTTSREERVIAAELQRALRRAGLREVRVAAVASSPGKESFLKIEHLRISGLAELARAAAAVERR